jgi:hypothetical protein
MAPEFSFEVALKSGMSVVAGIVISVPAGGAFLIERGTP